MAFVILASLRLIDQICLFSHTDQHVAACCCLSEAVIIQNETIFFIQCSHLCKCHLLCWLLTLFHLTGSFPRLKNSISGTIKQYVLCLRRINYRFLTQRRYQNLICWINHCFLQPTLVWRLFKLIGLFLFKYFWYIRGTWPSWEVFIVILIVMPLYLSYGQICVFFSPATCGD